MNFKRAVLLAITFFILIILYYFVETPSGKKGKEEPRAFIPGFDSKRAALIRLKQAGKGPLTLIRQGGGWQVQSGEKIFAAEPAPVNKMLDTVAGLKAATVASRNSEKFDAFEVTGDKGTEVKIDDADSNVLAHFIVGKNGPDIFSTYVRNQGADRVILTNGILKNVFEKDLSDWRDKTVFKLNKQDITGYLIEGDMTLQMQKDDSQNWAVQEPGQFLADKKAAEETVAKFASLKAAGFEDNATKCSLDRPSRTITASLKSGDAAVLLVGKEKNAFQHFVQVSGKDTIFVLEDYLLESLSPTPDKLKGGQKEDTKQPETAAE